MLGTEGMASKSKLTLQDRIDGFGEPSTGIYVIEAGSAVKIGISANPGARARNLQTGQEKPVTIFWAVRVPKRCARRVEMEVHKTLQQGKFHAQGEWFYINPDYARGVVEEEIAKQRTPFKVDFAYGYDR